MNKIISVVRVLLAFVGLMLGVFSTNFPAGSPMRSYCFIGMLLAFLFVLLSGALVGNPELPGDNDVR